MLRPKPHHSSIRSTSGHNGISEHLLVVLAIDPAFAGDGGVIKESQQIRSPVVIAGNLGKISLRPAPMLLDVLWRLRDQGVLIDGSVFRKSPGRNLSSHRSMLKHTYNRLRENLTHNGRLQAPAAETLHQRLLTTGLHHKQHPLLRFRQQELVRSHALFTGWNPVEIQLNPHIPFGGHL